MSKKEYKLSRTLYGHSSDVRSLAVTPNNDIISGSRDQTSKFWKFNSLQSNYEEVMTFRSQKNFVASVLYIDPTEEYPDGLIVTGGNDHAILIYKPFEPFVTFTIKDHTNTVSCLGKSNESNSFLSGSWDNTAKHFKIVGSPKCQSTFSGHSAAIWGVIQLSDNRVVTASADKTIGIWEITGQKLQTLTGHTDCVRSLADFPQLNLFVSVANDASVRVWSYSGENVNTLYGHTNYIYSITRVKGEGEFCFATSDEARTIKYWENGENVQNIVLPAQSIWSVAGLPNGDIIAGASDGIVRVFTRDETRYADEETMTKFKEDVEALEMQSAQEIGGVKVSDLPGKEALFQIGKKDGEMKMIREEGKIVAYKWVLEGTESHWEKVGEVMGGTDKDSSGKTIYEGKAYDYVFSVDVEEGKPPLKLPYNKGDDVYVAANAFLTKHMLPPDYLEQVVDFILKNTKEPYVLPANSAYQDPFTGGNRYTPSYQNATSQMGVNVDPFTGGNSYATSSAKPSTSSATVSSGGNADPFTGSSSYSTQSSVQSGASFFPVSSYRTFDAADPAVILNKLKEFNSKLSTSQVNNDELDSLSQLCSGAVEDPGVYELLFNLLDWPEEYVFPVLDVVRLAVKNAVHNEILVFLQEGKIIEILLKYIVSTTKVANNTIVALRALCNLCSHEAGETLVFNKRFDIVENITSLGQLNKNAQIALATLLLNLTLMSVKKNDDIGFSVLAQVLADIITKLTDPESQFRSYVALGTLVIQSNVHRQEVIGKINSNPNFITTLQLHCFGGNDLENKRSNCAKQLQSLL